MTRGVGGISSKVVSQVELARRYKSVLESAKKAMGGADSSRYKSFETRLEDKYKPSIEADAIRMKSFLDKLEDQLKEYEELKKVDEKVKKKQEELDVIRKDDSKHAPGDIDMAKLGPWFEELMVLVDPELEAVGGRRIPGWNTRGPNDNLMLRPESRRDAQQEIINTPSLITYPNPRPGGVMMPFFGRDGLHRALPFPRRVLDFEELLWRARKGTSEKLYQKSKDIDFLLVHGDNPPERKEKTKSSVGEKAEDLGLILADALNFVTQKVGRGIWSKTDPKKSKRFENYIRDRNDYLTNLLWKLNPNQSKHAKFMETIKKALEAGKNAEDGLFDEATFKNLVEIIDGEIKAANLGFDQQNKEINETINKLNREMYDHVKKHTADADAAWKFRALQMFLIISPFMGIAYMSAISNVFSGVFIGQQGIGEGVASLATGQYTGIFGDIANAIGVDDLIRFILTDVPIIKDIVNLLNYFIQSSVAQGLGSSLVVPALNSIVLPLVIAGVYSLYRAADEIEHYIKYDDIFSAQNKKLKDTVSKLYDNIKNHEERRKESAVSALDQLAKAHIPKDQQENFKKKFKDSLLKTGFDKEEIKKKRDEVEELVKTLKLGSVAHKAVLDGARKIYDDFHEGPNTKEFVSKFDGYRKKCYDNKFISEFYKIVCENHPKMLSADTIKLLKAQGIVTEDAFDKNILMFDQKKMTAYLVKDENAAMKEKFDNFALLYCGIQGATIAEKIAKVHASYGQATGEDERKKIIAAQQKFRDQQYVIELAGNHNIDLDNDVYRELLEPIQDLAPDVFQAKVDGRNDLIKQLKKDAFAAEIKSYEDMTNERKGLVSQSKLDPSTKVARPMIHHFKTIADKGAPQPQPQT